jgi:hypothetical protein
MYKIAFKNGYCWEDIKGYSVSIGAVEKVHLTANYANPPAGGCDLCG